MAKAYSHVKELAAEIDAVRQKNGYSYNSLARAALIDPAHCSRICKGDFKRLNQGVLQICNALGVAPPDGKMPALPSPFANIILPALATFPDQSAQGAEKLAKVLRAMSDLTPSHR